MPTVKAEAVSESASASTSIPYFDSNSLIKSDGSYWIWGRDQLVPTHVQGISDVKYSYGRFFVKNDNTVWYWKQTMFNYNSADLIQVKELDGGYAQAEGSGGMAIRDLKGNVFFVPWVDNDIFGYDFRIVEKIDVDHITDLTSFDKSASYMRNWVFLKDNGTVWAYSGFRPRPVAAVKGLHDIIDIYRNYALKSDGTVWYWTGEPNESAEQIKGLVKIKSILPDFFSRLFIDEQARLWYGGSNINSSNEELIKQQTPVMIASINDVKDAVTIRDSLIVLTQRGDVYETPITQHSMTKNPKFNLLATQVVSIKSAESHFIMQKNDGTLWGWGTNTNAELGAGDNRSVAKTPVPVGSPISLEVNGEDVLLTSGVIMRNNQSFIPLRSLLVMLNASIRYDSNSNIVIESKEGTSPPIRISINWKSGAILLNEKPTVSQTKAFLLNGTSYIPLRFVSEQLGADVSWSKTENKLSITLKELLP